jgi:chlorite dismutase
MPERRAPPPTEEGWYALHDFRRIDWDAWAAASDDERDAAVQAGVDRLEALVDADEGPTAAYTILGHKADLLVVHLRPETHQLDAIEREIESSPFGRFTDRATSYLSVTEASGYSERARQYFEGDLDESSGLARYIRSRLYPEIPDWEHVCFYPMDKRRDPEQNWYDLPFDERAEHMDAHGDIGRDYGGRVTQMITGSIGLDDWEWGVTLWAEDLADVKDLLYEMRFDPSTSQFAEFGKFYVGRRIEPADLPAVMAGAAVTLALVSVAVDEPVTEWLALTLGWTFTGGADGASAVLGVIAGSMITIAGVVFSMTLIALSLASSQLGPRLLRTFMRDTRTQVVLGTFIASFVYCLLVLRTIRRAEEFTFVPHLSVSLERLGHFGVDEGENLRTASLVTVPLAFVETTVLSNRPCLCLELS